MARTNADSTLRDMHIEIDDLSRPQVRILLEEHLANMCELSPTEQVFVLAITKLRASEIKMSKPKNRCSFCL